MNPVGPKETPPVRCRLHLCRRLAALLAILLLLGSDHASQGDASVTAQTGQFHGGLELWYDGLALLHAGRTDESLEWFLARQRERPDDLCGLYFPALVYTSFDVDGLTDEEQEGRGWELLERGIGIGRDRLDDREADFGTRYCLGTLYGLRAAERLQQSKYMGAAFDARRARRVMLDLLEDQPECVDCRFWVGAYDYFAAVLPGIIRFFRSVLFFPRGDKERGLETLWDVAERGALDRYNALWLLYSIYRGLEQDPQQSVMVLGRLRESYPDSIDASLALGWHYARVADPPDRARNIAIHLQALARVGTIGGLPAEQLSRRVRLSLSRAYLDDLRPGAAADVLRPVLRSVRGRPDQELSAAHVMVIALNRAGLHAEAVRLLDDLRTRYPDDPQLELVERATRAFDAGSSNLYREVVDAWRLGREGDVKGAEAVFGRLLSGREAKGLIHFGMAGMYFDLGRHEDAEAHYRSAVAAGIDGAPQYLPFSYLRIGNLLDLRGERRSAKSFYRMAANEAGEHEWVRRAATHYLEEPYTGSPGGLPPL